MPDSAGTGTGAAPTAGRGAGRAGLLTRLPVWAWLGALVVVSTAIRYALGRRIVAPWIFVDELIYSELAKSFGAGGRFLLRDESSPGYGFIYPILVAPAWAAFSAIPDAYAAAKGINALVMSLAAIPAYLLARRVLGKGWALLAAALTVAVPSMLYTGVLMTENVFYPLFLLAALSLVAYLDSPRWWRGLLLLGAVLLCYLARSQAVALLPAVVTAPLLHGFYERRSLRETVLQRHRLLFGGIAAAVLLVVVVQVARGKPILGVLGAYQAATGSTYSTTEVLRWLFRHVAELDLYLGVLPFAALVLVALQARSLPTRARSFAAAAVTLTFWLVLLVAAFASQPAVLRVEERNMFYVAPLFLIALLLFAQGGVAWSRKALLVAAGLAAALPGLLPYHLLIGTNVKSDTLALIPWWRLQDSLFGLGDVAYVVAGCSVAAAALLFLVPRRYALVLPLLVGVYFAAAQQPIESSVHGFRWAGLGALFTGQTTGQRDWIDRAVGRDADVAVLWSGNAHAFTVWENEFFNRSLGPVYFTSGGMPGGLPETGVTVEDSTGLLLGPDGKEIRHRYVLADGSVELSGRIVARDERKGIVLVRASGPLRSLTKVVGLYPNDSWSGREVTYTRRACTGGTATAQVRNDPSLRATPVTVTAIVRGETVARAVVEPGIPAEVKVPLAPEGGTCVATFVVDPVTVPAEATNGANPDPRELGLHFDRFDYAAPGDGAADAAPGA